MKLIAMIGLSAATAGPSPPTTGQSALHLSEAECNDRTVNTAITEGEDIVCVCARMVRTLVAVTLQCR